jgi:hypothetical protein
MDASYLMLAAGRFTFKAQDKSGESLKHRDPSI